VERTQGVQVCVERDSTPPYIGEGAAPMGWLAKPWSAPTYATIMWVEVPLTHSNFHLGIEVSSLNSCGVSHFLPMCIWLILTWDRFLSRT
jgi:hypothetical protein